MAVPPGTIRSAFDCVLRLGLSSWDRLVSLKSLEVPSEHRRTVLGPTCTHTDEFRSALKFRAYNFQLFDESLIQLSDSGATKRFAYLPVPTELMIEEEFEWGSSGASPMGVLPRLRIDADARAYEEFWHTSVHLTIGGMGECRIPVAYEFDAEMFVLFIARHIYLLNVEIDGTYSHAQQMQYLEDSIRQGKRRMLKRAFTLSSPRDCEQPYLS